MATDLRVYDNEHGDIVVITVTTGCFDVSRLVALMEKGRSEDAARAIAITRAVRRHNSGHAALRLLTAHGGPDLLEPASNGQGSCGWGAWRNAPACARCNDTGRFDENGVNAHCTCKTGRRMSELWYADKHGLGHPDHPDPEPDFEDGAPF